MTFQCLLMVSLLVCAALSTAAAADYPARPIRIVVSGAPGGAADLIGRPVAAADIIGRPVAVQSEKETGWSLVIDNRAGAEIRKYAEIARAAKIRPA